MKSGIIKLIFVAMASSSLVFANGGGYIRGGVQSTGDVVGFEPKATEHIQIIDEKLHIRVGKTHASVEVRYLMRNMTEQKVTVRFGFPVEESSGVNYLNLPDEASRKSTHKQPIYCKNYQIAAAGKPLKVTWQAETNPENEKIFRGLSGWNISQLTFAKGQEIPVMIRFDSEYPNEYWSVSDDQSTSASMFRYRLSTAACWHGPISQGRILIESDGIDPADIRIIKPVNLFKKDGDRWVWNFEDLEPTLADDIEIECQPTTHIYTQQPIGKWREGHPSHLYAQYIERGKQWSMLHSNYSVKASSTLKPDGDINYHPENIRNQWDQDVWSEGAEGPGVGEWLEITPVEPKPLLAIHIKPGYQKDTLFKSNARPKAIRIDLNGEHHFNTDIPDLQEEVQIPVIGYTKSVKKIRLTFTEVYPGSQHQDLCVTQVKLHAKLDRKPNVQPAR